MYYSDFEVFDVICYVPEDRYAHDEQIKLYIFDLVGELLSWRPLQDRLNFYFLLLFFGELLLLGSFFPFELPIFHGEAHLFGYLFVAIVYDLDEKVATFIDGCTVEHEDFEDIADDALVVDGQVHFHGVHLAG